MENNINQSNLQTDMTIQNLGVLIIDMQEMFLPCVSPTDRQIVTESCIGIADYCSDNNVPLILVTCEEVEERKTIEAILITAKYKDISITKNTEDAFMNIELEKVLNIRNIRNIFLAGINASYCVKQTAKGALKRGFKILTAENSIADPKGYETHGKSRDWYKANGLFVADYNSIFC